MGKIIAKIVLTGGPCAGKTTALSKIEEELTEKKYKVLIVSESATELIKGGIKCFGNNCLDIVTFQDLILKYQYEKEKIYEMAALNLPEDSKVVIIYDRGLLDNKAYINQSIFDSLLKKQNLSELDIMDNYNMVIHLVTAADGALDAYTLNNNNARTETPEEAKKLDIKTVNAWAGHSNLKIIKNNTDFKTKIQNVVDEINNLIGEPISTRKQRKFLIDLTLSDLSFLNKDNSTMIYIEQSYLDSKSSLEKRLRKRTYNGQSSYYLTLQQKMSNGHSIIYTNRKISEKEYNRLLNESQNVSTISKNRYSFSIDKQYFKLDIFNDIKNYAILEIDPTYDNVFINLPSNIKVIEEVTDNQFYDNHVISEQKEKSKVKMKLSTKSRH